MQGRSQQDEPALRQQLRAARARLDELVVSLHEADRSLQGFETERSKFALLATACDALYELETLGSGPLFWGAEGEGRSSNDRLRQARARLDEFEKQLLLAEEHRQTLLEEIERQQDTADVFAGYILDAERLAEEARNEWLIERDVDVLPIRATTMPWARGQEDDRRFRRSLLLALLVSIGLGVVLPQIEIPIPDRWQILEEQERLTELVREDLPLPPAQLVPEALPEPVAPEQVDESVPVASETESPTLAEQDQPESNPAPAAQANTGRDAGPGQGAGNRGILAFREKFAGIAATNDAVDRLGSNATIHDPTAVADGRPERSMVTSQAPGASGGINVAALSRGTGGGNGNQLSGVAVTRATSTLGTGNGNGTGTGGAGGNGQGGARKVGGSATVAGRTDEEIQIVFDRHKAALYRLYNRELRQNPTLKGQMILRLTIQPDGSVSFCEVKSSDMKAPELAAQVVARVKTFDFGAKPEIPAVTIVYPIDFLPAT